MHKLNISNGGKISTEQSITWAAVTGAAKLFIAKNVSYKTWIE